MPRFRNTLALAVLLGAPGIARAAPATVLHAFTGGSDGGRPAGNVVVDAHGHIFGSTMAGGTANLGTIFEISPPAAGATSWTTKVLYSFDGTHGALPYAAPVLDAAGNIYVTTSAGGGSCAASNGAAAGGCGQIVKLAPPTVTGAAWDITTLYQFKGGEDGASPLTPVVFDDAGNIYVATYGGGGTACTTDGVAGCGTLVRLSPPAAGGGAWDEQVLYRFAGGGLGANPAGLARDAGGVLYVTLQYGGAWQAGTVASLQAPVSGVGRWTPDLLYAFNPAISGMYPVNPPVLDGAGNIYVTTPLGSGHNTYGTLLRLSPPASAGAAWQTDILHSFNGKLDGAEPETPLITGSGTILLATAQGGSLQCGGTGCGTLVSLAPRAGAAGAVETILFRLTSASAYFIGAEDWSGGLATDTAGHVYITSYGSWGAVAKLPGVTAK